MYWGDQRCVIDDVVMRWGVGADLWSLRACHVDFSGMGSGFTLTTTTKPADKMH
jgi:hypothetical protein